MGGIISILRWLFGRTARPEPLTRHVQEWPRTERRTQQAVHEPITSLSSTEQKPPAKRKLRRWESADVTALRESNCYNQPIVGESFYQDVFKANTREFEQNARGDWLAVAELREGQYEGEPVIEVCMNGRRCGAISKKDLPALLNEVRPIWAYGKPVMAMARFTGSRKGFYMSLSIARPLQVLD